MVLFFRGKAAAFGFGFAFAVEAADSLSSRARLGFA
jgi:hypothetical protein